MGWNLPRLRCLHQGLMRGAESIGSAGLGLSEQCSGARSGLMWRGSEARPASHARQYLALI